MAIPKVIDDIDEDGYQVSASNATIYSYRIKNENGYPIYVKFYNKALASVNPSTDTPDLTVTVAANTEVSDTATHAFSTALSVRCATRNVNSETNAPAVSPLIELQLEASGGSSGLTTTDDIQTALNAASAGSVVVLGPGTWDLGSNYLEIPDNVHLTGAGQDVTVIKSKCLGTGTQKHGIVAPGTNSVIRDLSIIGYSPSGTDGSGYALGNEDINPFSIRTGCTKTWDNVTWINVHFFGLNDCIFSQGGNLNNNTFINCLIEGQCDLVMHQNVGTLTFVNCELRSIANPHFTSLTNTGFFTGDFTTNNIIRAYGCRYVTIGDHTTHQAIPIEVGGPMDIYDMVIDYRDSLPSGISFDISIGDVNVAFLSNIRRRDGKPLVFDSAGATSLFNCSVPFTTTVAKLPDATHAQVGQQFVVTDGAAALAWGATVTGGSTNKYLVAWNGTNWTVIGK